MLGAAALQDVDRRRALGDGETLDLDGMTLCAHYTPGHSAGHVAFEIVETSGLIAGDLISAVSTILIEPWSGSMGEYLDSLARMNAKGYRTLFPGHGPPLPGKAFANLIEHRRRRESAILEQMSCGETSLAAIARAAYRDVPQAPQALIELQTLAHLVDLERRGIVRRVDDERRWERS